MRTIRKSRLATLAVLGLPLALLVALVALVSWGDGSTQKAHAAVDTSLNMSISATGCQSSGTPTAKCTEAIGGSFTVNFNVDALPSNGSYIGYDLKISYAGNVSYVAGSLVQQGAGFWPGCAFPVGDSGATTSPISTACAFGTSGVPSTYIGVIAGLGFTCGAQAGAGTITLGGGDGNTDLADESLAPHSEAADETLTINCGGGGGETPTNTPPAGATPTNTPPGPPPTPTPTRAAPTPTHTPAPKACGDVNDSGSVNPVDAQLILQLSAGLITSLPNAPSADVDRNGTINPVDATLILQESAGLLPASGLHCY